MRSQEVSALQSQGTKIDAATVHKLSLEAESSAGGWIRIEAKPPSEHIACART